MGAFDLLVKPLGAKTMASAVRRALDASVV